MNMNRLVVTCISSIQEVNYCASSLFFLGGRLQIRMKKRRDDLHVAIAVIGKEFRNGVLVDVTTARAEQGVMIADAVAVVGTSNVPSLISRTAAVVLRFRLVVLITALFTTGAKAAATGRSRTTPESRPFWKPTHFLNGS
jgi:hypothetical protein